MFDLFYSSYQLHDYLLINNQYPTYLKHQIFFISEIFFRNVCMINRPNKPLRERQSYIVRGLRVRPQQQREQLDDRQKQKKDIANRTFFVFKKILLSIGRCG